MSSINGEEILKKFEKAIKDSQKMDKKWRSINCKCVRKCDENMFLANRHFLNGVAQSFDVEYICEIFEKINIIKSDLERLEEYDNALKQIASRKPVMLPFEPQCGGDNINQYLKDLADYIISLSNTENLIISAVYERLKRENEKKKQKKDEKVV